MQGISLELDEDMIENADQRELLQELISNSKLSEGYLTLARDLDVMEPKTPDDLYKVCTINLGFLREAGKILFAVFS